MRGRMKQPTKAQLRRQIKEANARTGLVTCELHDLQQQYIQLSEDIERAASAVHRLYKVGVLHGAVFQADGTARICIRPNSYYHEFLASEFDWMRKGSLNQFEKTLATKVASDIRKQIVDQLYNR